MGVKACARKGCENIMCDRYSKEHGYICYECFSEMVAIEMVGCLNIPIFMSTESDQNDEDMVRAILNNEFKVSQ